MIYDFKLKCLSGHEDRIIIDDEFINNNNLKLIPFEEIEKLIGDDSDVLGFKKEVILNLLPWSIAKKYFAIEYIQEIERGEKTYKSSITTPKVAQDFLDYMVFAWAKAMDERGISASRSIQKLATWLRALNRPDIADVLEDDSLYSPYGKPALAKACLLLKIDYPTYLD